MGTHPIFESDFDCLTEKLKMMNRLARPVNLMANQVRTSAGPITKEVVSAWWKVSYIIGPIMVIPAFMVMEIRHPHIQLRPPANQAPWINVLDDKMPWESTGKKTPFFHDDYNTIAQKGYLDGNNAGGLVPNQEHH